MRVRWDCSIAWRREGLSSLNQQVKKRRRASLSKFHMEKEIWDPIPWRKARRKTYKMEITPLDRWDNKINSKSLDAMLRIPILKPSRRLKDKGHMIWRPRCGKSFGMRNWSKIIGRISKRIKKSLMSPEMTIIVQDILPRIKHIYVRNQRNLRMQIAFLTSKAQV